MTDKLSEILGEIDMKEKSDLNILILGDGKKWHSNQQTWKNGGRHPFGNYSNLVGRILQ